MNGGEKDIDHQNAMAGEWSESDHAEYQHYLDQCAAERLAEQK